MFKIILKYGQLELGRFDTSEDVESSKKYCVVKANLKAKTWGEAEKSFNRLKHLLK